MGAQIQLKSLDGTGGIAPPCVGGSIFIILQRTTILSLPAVLHSDITSVQSHILQ